MESTDATAAAAAAAAAPDFNQYVTPSWDDQTDQTGKIAALNNQIAALEKRVGFLEEIIRCLLPKTNMTPASEMAHAFGMVTAPAVAPVPTITTPASDMKSTDKDTPKTTKKKKGKIFKWNSEKGYGFIQVEGEKKHIFCHFMGCKEGGKLREKVDHELGDAPVDHHLENNPADWALGTVEFVLKKLVKKDGTKIVADQVDFA